MEHILETGAKKAVCNLLDKDLQIEKAIRRYQVRLVKITKPEKQENGVRLPLRNK